MIRILDRYVAGQFLRTFTVLVLGLPLLFIIVDATDNLDRYLGRGVTPAVVAMSYLYQIPLFVFYSFPIAALVGTVFTIGGMTNHQEITAAKAAGVSFYRLVVPVIALGAVMSAGALVLGDVVPLTSRIRSEMLGERGQQVSSMRTNFVFQSERAGMMSVRRLDPGAASMAEVVLERKATPKVPGFHAFAQVGEWREAKGWVFENGYLRVLSSAGDEHAFSYERMRIPSLKETPTELMAEPMETEDMRYAEISRFITAVERSGGNPRKLIVERAQKIALPLAVFVIVLFGAPLATSSQRGGTAYGVGISLLITLVYLMLFRVAQALGSGGAIEPVLAAWLPNGIFLVAGLVLLSRVRT